jgi:hypothetical protein
MNHNRPTTNPELLALRHKERLRVCADMIANAQAALVALEKTRLVDVMPVELDAANSECKRLLADLIHRLLAYQEELRAKVKQ